jgi:hypothetical protein
MDGGRIVFLGAGASGVLNPCASISADKGDEQYRQNNANRWHAGFLAFAVRAGNGGGGLANSRG